MKILKFESDVIGTCIRVDEQTEEDDLIFNSDKFEVGNEISVK